MQSGELISRMLEEKIDEEGENVSLTQLRMLMMLKRHNSPLTSAELGRCIFRKSQSVTTALNQLKKNGYVVMTADEKDKRLIRIHITESGERLLSKYIRWLSRNMNDMVSCFTGDELFQIQEYMKRFRYWLFQLSGVDLVEPTPGFDGTENFLQK